jgi:hypothetical protein
VRWVSLEELPQLELAHPLYRSLLAQAVRSPLPERHEPRTRAE